MKKTLLLLGAAIAINAQAAPSLSLSPTTIEPGTPNPVVSLNYVADNNLSMGIKFTLNLPAGVTLDKVNSSGAPFNCTKNSAGEIVVDGVDFTGAALKSTTGICQLVFVVPAGSTGSIVPTKTFEEHSDLNSAEVAVDTKLPSIQIKSSTPPPVETKYALVAKTDGNGSLSCMPAGDQAAGTAITCTANPSQGFEVAVWGDSCSGTAKTATVCNFKMPAQKALASVAFVKKQVTPPTTYTVTTDKNITNGSVTCNPSQGVAGTVAACTAAPKPGFRFERWTNCPGTAAGTTCQITLSDNVMDLSAVFSPIPSQPATPSTAAHPVPAVGILGLLAMLASLAGAASLVLRKKQA